MKKSDNENKKVVYSVVDLWNAYRIASYENHPIASTIYNCWTGNRKFSHFYEIQNGGFLIDSNSQLGNYLDENVFNITSLGNAYLCSMFENNMSKATKIRKCMFHIYQLSITDDINKKEKIEAAYLPIYEDMKLVQFIRKRQNVEAFISGKIKQRNMKDDEKINQTVSEQDLNLDKDKEYIKAA